MTSTAQARTWLAQIQDLITRFTVIFPAWPSLAAANAALTRAARQLDQIDAGRSPFTPDNPDPAGTAINPAYSFLHYMATTATATDGAQLLDPMTGRALKIEAPTRPDGSAAGIQETIDLYRSQLARIEQIRAAGGGTPQPPPPAAPAPSTPPTSPTPSPSPTITTAPTTQAPAVSTWTAPAASAAPATAYGPSAPWAAPAASYAPAAFAEPGAQADAIPSAKATGGNWLPILGLGVLGLLMLGGKKGGSR